MKRFRCLGYLALFFVMLALAVSCSPLEEERDLKKDVADIEIEFAGPPHTEEGTYMIRGSNIEWQTEEDGWEEIDLILPDEHEGLPVTEIGAYAFAGSGILRNVSIPESITKIGGNAFYGCKNLETLFIPKSVEKLGESPFRGCQSLKTVTVDPENPRYCSVDGVVYTKDGKSLVFYPPSKAGEAFTVPEGVEVICPYAFFECENLKRITVPATVNDISYESILSCVALEGVFIDVGNEIYRSVDGNLYTKDGRTLLRFYVTLANTHLVIPEGVMTVADRAAYGYKSLTALTFPETLVSIGDTAFWGTSVQSLRIPKNVREIGKGAFAECKGLKTAIFEEPKGWWGWYSDESIGTSRIFPRLFMRMSRLNAWKLTKKYDDWVWNRDRS